MTDEIQPFTNEENDNAAIIMPDKKLRIREELFCRYYVQNGRYAVQAAISAGYKRNTAESFAWKILKNPDVMEFINKLQAPVLEKLNIDEDWVLTKLKNFADADISDFFEINEGKLIIKDLKKLPKEKTAAIESIKATKLGIEIKLVDKRSCLADIGKYLGMFKKNADEKVDHQYNVTLNCTQDE
jgi:hypothetical protein